MNFNKKEAVDDLEKKGYIIIRVKKGAVEYLDRTMHKRSFPLLGKKNEKRP